MVASRPLRSTFQGQEVSWQIMNKSLLPVVGFDLDRGLVCTSTPAAASVDNLKIAPSEVTMSLVHTHVLISLMQALYTQLTLGSATFQTQPCFVELRSEAFSVVCTQHQPAAFCRSTEQRLG